MPKSLDASADSDHAGDPVSRKSTSGLVLMYGEHCLKTSSTVQGPIGLSSGESEYYSCVLGGATLLGASAILSEWGVDPRRALIVRSDSSAAIGFAKRRGLGRQRHVSTRHLWLQDKVASGTLKVFKVATKDQLGDSPTKASTASALRAHMPRFGLRVRDGTARAQRELLLDDAPLEQITYEHLRS